MRRILGLMGVAAIAAILTGCTVGGPVDGAAPRQSHTPPASATPSSAAVTDDAVVLSTAGLGPLRMGAAVPGDSRLVAWDPTACPAIDDGSPAFGMWKPTARRTGDSPLGRDDAFGIVTRGHEQAAPVDFLQVWSSQYRTPSGLHVGSTNAQVRAALPSAAMLDTGQSQEYSVSSGGWRLTFTVAEPDGGAVTDDSVVQVISVDAAEGPQLTYWATDGGAVCGS